jgi:hypothetical protein
MDTLLDTIIGFQISWPLATMLGKDLHDDMYYIDLMFVWLVADDWCCFVLREK